MAKMIYNGMMLESMPLLRGEAYDIRIVQLVHEDKDAFIVIVDNLYNHKYKSLNEFAKFWKPLLPRKEYRYEKECQY